MLGKGATGWNKVTVNLWNIIILILIFCFTEIWPNSSQNHEFGEFFYHPWLKFVFVAVSRTGRSAGSVSNRCHVVRTWDAMCGRSICRFVTIIALTAIAALLREEHWKNMWWENIHYKKTFIVQSVENHAPQRKLWVSTLFEPSMHQWNEKMIFLLNLSFPLTAEWNGTILL